MDRVVGPPAFKEYLEVLQEVTEAGCRLGSLLGSGFAKGTAGLWGDRVGRQAQGLGLGPG